MEIAIIGGLAVAAFVALRFDALRHRATGVLVGATFGVFGVVGLVGAMFLLVLPAYRRSQHRREQEEALMRGQVRGAPLSRRATSPGTRRLAQEEGIDV